MLSLGSCGGSVVRRVTFQLQRPAIQSSENFLTDIYVFTVTCIQITKIKKMRPGLAQITLCGLPSHGAIQQKQMKAVLAQAESCCVYVKPRKFIKHMHGIIPCLFDCCVDSVVQLLLLKSSISEKCSTYTIRIWALVHFAAFSFNYTKVY